MRMVFRLSVAALLLVLWGVSAACADEFRGLYVDAFDPHPGLKSHEEVTQMVNAAKAANFNALIVQVRKRGDAYYKSHLEPRATDIAADYDPLADVIQQAHALGMQVHAWLSVYEVSHTKYLELPAAHVARANPKWLMSDRNGKATFGDGKIFVDPGIPEVSEQFVAVVKDIVTNYQVDGIHLDNLGYPSPKHGYSDASVARFNKQKAKAGIPEEKDEAWCQWRRDQITSLVCQVRSAISATKPGVVLSAAVPTATADLASKMVLMQWDVWTREHLVDFVVPMLFLTDDRMLPFAQDAMKSACDRHMYISVGAWRIGSDLCAKQIEDARAAGAQGVVVYSYAGLTNTTRAVRTTLSDLATTVFAEPASTPSMAWRQ